MEKIIKAYPWHSKISPEFDGIYVLTEKGEMYFMPETRKATEKTRWSKIPEIKDGNFKEIK